MLHRRTLCLLLALPVSACASREEGPPIPAAARQLYSARCTPCHGELGDGQGTGAAALNPRPRDFRDETWQRSISDDQIRAVILRGGAATGKSPAMPASSDLQAQPETLEGVIRVVRSFGGT